MKDSSPVFIDTNVYIYGIYGTSDQKNAVISLMEKQSVRPFISLQVLKEFTNACVKKKFPKTTEELKGHIQNATLSFTISDITTETIIDAIDIQTQYKYSFYDSLIIATALVNKCAILYSEDMQHGQIIRKALKILNPFKAI